MKAAELLAHGTPGQFQIASVPEPRPGPEEVLVQVHACGLNRLDLWLEEGALPIPVNLPRIPGSEVAGRIVALGEDVDEWQIGERVAIQSNVSCGECEFCLGGEESLCLHSELLGVQCDGGFAERVLAPWRSLVRLPDNVDFVTAAALTLAGSTAMHVLTDRAEVHPGDWNLVIAGASGVGSAAIQIAKQLGARVVATGSTEAKRKLAVSLGADYVVDSSADSWPAEVRQITQKRGVDLVIEHAGGAVLEQVFSCVARGGTVVSCGATAGREVRLNIWPIFVKQQRLVGSYGRNRADLTATLEWVAAGRLKPVIDRLYALEQIPSAFAALRARTVLGKLVVVPQP